MMGTGGTDNFRVVIIAGPKHSGKTSAGKVLARLWEQAVPGAPKPARPGAVRFIDLDELVESREGTSPRLLYRAGAEIFRRAEAEALRSLLEGAAPAGERPGGGSNHAPGKDRVPGDRVTIVAAGGGLADNREALELLKTSRTLVVYLEVSAETAWERIRAAAERTGELPPFLDTANPRETHRLLHERRGQVYRELAKITVKAGNSPEETASKILRRLMDVSGLPEGVSSKEAAMPPVVPLLERFSERAAELRVLNIRVFRNGEPIASADWDEEIRRNQYSVSKSFTSAAVGFALREDLLFLDERLIDAFPGETPPRPSPFLQEARIRDLLTMGLGQDRAYLMGSQRTSMDTDDWVRYALALPFVSKPGTAFVYSNIGPYLAGVLVQRRAGCDLVSYLMPRLFAPLGIHRPIWECDRSGYTFGAGGLVLSVSELAKFTQLYAWKGNWKGKQILNPEWVEESTAPQIDNAHEGYGYLFWRGPDNTYRADGKYGQFGIVAPDKRAVIAVNAESRDGAALLAHIHRTVIGAL
ncbi:MAG: serine hydrolase [Treponema sp.]|jgi:shikimate kinase|nr:serine hydrolase [Treponema sp.]